MMKSILQTLQSFWRTVRGTNGLFYLAIVTAVSLIALNEYGYRNSSLALQTVNQLEQQRLSLSRIRTLMMDAENSQRGYLITGKEDYLIPYNKAIADFNPALNDVRQYYSKSESDLAEFAKLSRPASRKMAEMEVTIKLRKAAPEQMNWIAAINTDVGKESMDDMRNAMEHLTSLNRTAMSKATQSIKNNLLFSRLAIGVAALGAVIAFYLFLRQVQQSVRQEIMQRQQLASERDALDSMVRERTVRMTELANHLLNVQEGERGRLARELHDEMGALFTAAKMDVSRIRSRLGSNVDEAVQKRLVHLNESLNAGVALKRRIIEDLMPSSLTNLGLLTTLEIQAREFQERTGIEVETLLEDVKTNKQTSLTIFRIVQESLNNITKYAQASHVKMILEQRANYLELRVEDDGKGFDPNQVMNKSHGLPGMRHRVEALSGVLNIRSAPGEGARVQVMLPIPKDFDDSTAQSTPPNSGLAELIENNAV